MSELERIPMIGIGASAGSIDALQDLFRTMPADTGMVFVVAHLDPERRRVLDDILGRCSGLPILWAYDGEQIDSNHIYMLPPNAVFTIEHGGLRLRKPKAAGRERNPIDNFLGAFADRPVEPEDRVQIVALTVEPFGEQENGLRFLVVLDDVGLRLDPAAMQARALRERLRSTIKEYEIALGELKASNAELRSKNGELERLKAALRSTTAKLNIMNLNLIRTIEDLDQTNDEWNTLVESSQIATLFLDRHLVVRRFTSRAAAIFDLRSGDSGRPLTDIARSLGDPDLRRDIRAVLEAGEPRERCLAIRTATEAAPVRYLARLLPYRTVHGVDGVVASFTDVTRLVEAEERQRFRVAELNHRINNMLTVAIGLARQTLAYTSEPTAFAQAFQARLHALRRTSELLSLAQWDEIDLRELLMRALQPYALVGAGSRATAEGPPVTLRPKAALALGMVAHELATNAMKHGALSVLEGGVTVRWLLGGRAGERRLILSWEEHGGPSTANPATEGFGSKLIRRLLSDDLGGEAQIGYQEGSLRARLIIPANPMFIRIGDQAR